MGVSSATGNVARVILKFIFLEETRDGLRHTIGFWEKDEKRHNFAEMDEKRHNFSEKTKNITILRKWTKNVTMFQKDEKHHNFLEMDEKHHMKLSVPYPTDVNLFGAPQVNVFSALGPATPRVFGAARQRESEPLLLPVIIS